MPKSTLSKYIPVLIEHPLGEFLKNARKAYRQAFPDELGKPGRDSEEGAVLQAMKDIFMNSKETSVHKWTQADWARKINKVTNISRRTIHKHVKEILRRNVVPIHMIPSSLVKLLSLEQQRSHWFAIAMLEVVRSVPADSMKISIPYQDLYSRYQKLLKKHTARHSE